MIGCLECNNLCGHAAVVRAITPLAMMRIRFSSPHKVHGHEGHAIVQAEEWRSVPTCHHPSRIVRCSDTDLL